MLEGVDNWGVLGKLLMPNDILNMWVVFIFFDESPILLTVDSTSPTTSCHLKREFCSMVASLLQGSER